MSHLWYNGWQPLLRIAIVGIVSYATLIVFLRASGKRTLSKMNAYDMVITMALGAVLTKAMLTADQTIAETVTAIFLLVAFQYLLSVGSCHLPWFRKLVVAAPTVLFHDDTFQHAAMRKERLTEEEVRSAVKEKGIPDLAWVDAVILGSNGELSVLIKAALLERLSVLPSTTK